MAVFRSRQGRRLENPGMTTNSYDALIVGSGITGGWAAKELTEKGLTVLILEAGRSIVPDKDYVEHVPVWELKYRGWDERVERQRMRLAEQLLDLTPRTVAEISRTVGCAAIF